MRFLHLGDLHLGKSLEDYDLIDDQEYILNQILDLAQKKTVDAVLLAGDIYDKAIPSESAVNLLDCFLRGLAQRNIKVFMISGNHDSDDRLNFGSSFFAEREIYISSVFEGRLYRKTLTDAFGEIDVYLLPFVKASQVRHFFPEEKIDTYEDAVKTILKHSAIDKNRRNVLVAHQFVAGHSDPDTAGSEGISVRNVGTIEKIGYDCFDAFDYVALGHIHSPQSVGREEIRYSGSILKYSKSEVMNEKSVSMLTIEEKGKTEITLLPLKPRRNVRQLKGTMDKLLKPENVVDPDDFIYVTLTEEDIIPNAINIFRQYYPNTLGIVYENSHTRELETVDIRDIAKDRSFQDLISDFYQQMYGCGISEEEMLVMSEVAKEAGILDETN